MSIAIKVDEDLPTEIVQRLVDAGHNARTVHDQGWTGMQDEQLWPKIQEENRCLFTADKGFANATLHPPGSHTGIVLFRLPRESRSGYIRLIEFLLERVNLDDILGAIVVVSPDAIRVHRL